MQIRGSSGLLLLVESYFCPWWPIFAAAKHISFSRKHGHILNLPNQLINLLWWEIQESCMRLLIIFKQKELQLPHSFGVITYVIFTLLFSPNTHVQRIWHEYGCGICVTEFRHLDPLNLKLFEEKVHKQSNISSILHGWEINYILFFNPNWFQVHFLIISDTLFEDIIQYIIRIVKCVSRTYPRTQFWIHTPTS